jgi:hypothetical protein
MIRWLEANGYNVSYSTDVDTDRRGSELLEHRVFLSVGHDEYWSGGQRAAVEAARDAGVNLAFFSGNESYWKVRWENSVDASGTPYRTLVTYKESKDNARTDPLDVSNNVWTGTWRDQRFSPPADGGRPENGLTGTLYVADRTTTDLGIPMTVGDQDGQLRFWRNTSVASLAAGQTATLGQFVVGYEVDADQDNGYRPAGLVDMSSTTFSAAEMVTVPWGTEYGPGTVTHKITLYRAPSRALVFGAGTIQWSWGLDGTHNDGTSTASVPMRQATVNLFADMGVQPGSLQTGLVAATASTDVTKPTSTITAPAAGAVFQVGSPVTITGTAADAGGGKVGGVEVSADGGATWHPAAGRGTWTYTWIPAAGGAVTLKARAVDDSGNLETPGAGVGVTVSTANTLVAAYSFDAGTGTTLADTSGKGNNGTIANATWITAGRFGSALSFNGTNALVTIADANSLDLAGALTLEAWVYPTAINGWETVILKEASGDLTYALYGDNNGNDVAGAPRRPTLSLRQGTTTYMGNGATQLALNTWTHLAATYDGANMRLYVNGSLAGTAARTGSVNVSANPLRIGGNNVWGEWFNGRIDEVRVYSRALAAGEIQSDMNTPVGAPDTQAPTAPASLTATGSVSSVALSWAAATDNTGIDHYNVYRSTTSGFTPATGNLVGLAASATYTDSGLVPGTYFYRVIAADPAGNLSPASPQATGVVTGDISAPTVSVTAPANNATVSGTVGLTATAADDIGVVGVQFLLDGANFGAEDTTSPYSASWSTTPADNGPHTLTAVARDAAGHATTSAAVTVTVNNFVDTTGPTVSVSAPADGATVAGTVSVTANAVDDVGVVGVQFYVDGTTLLTDDTTVPYSASWNTTATGNGSHQLTAVARDAAGHMTMAGTVTVTVSNDLTPPTVSVTAPAAGATVSGSVSVTADAADSVGVVGVQFKLDGANLGAEDTTAPYAVTWDASAADGPHTLAAVARDAAGNVTTSGPVSVTVFNPDVTPPAVSLTAPANNSAVSGSVAVSATASDNVGVTGVTFFLDGATLLGDDITSPYSVPWGTTAAANGTHTLTAVARDAAGNTTTSATVTVTVDNSSPAVSVSAPANNATVSGSLVVTADAADNVGVVGVQFKLDGANLGAEDTTTPYSVNWATTGVANGSHTLTAIARDAAGNTTTSSIITITVNNPVTGLVGAWGFEEGTGTTTADVSGHALTGTLANATWAAAGKYGNALSFNGTNAWVTVADNALLHLTTGMTIEAWVKPAAAGTDWRTAVLKERGTNGLAYALYAADGSNKPPAGYINRNGPDMKAVGTSLLSLNTWTHLAATYDGSTIRLYVNGTQVGTKSAAGTISASTSPLRFGGNGPWGEWFNGLIDEVRVYSTALTAAEIATDMNTPVGGGTGAQLADRPAVASTSRTAVLADDGLMPALGAAIDLWQAAGVPAAVVPAARTVSVHIADLPGSGLGFTDVPTGQIWLDRDAAGYGWGVEGYDLDTVLAHEVGHLLGVADFVPDVDRAADLMDQTLAPGEVRTPSPVDVRLALGSGRSVDPIPTPATGLDRGPLLSALSDTLSVPATGGLAAGPDSFVQRGQESDRWEDCSVPVKQPAIVDRVVPAPVGWMAEGGEKEWWTAEPWAPDPWSE